MKNQNDANLIKKHGRVRKILARVFFEGINGVVTIGQTLAKRPAQTKTCSMVKNLVYGTDKNKNNFNLFLPDSKFVKEDVSVFAKSRQRLAKLGNLKTKSGRKVKTIFFFHGGAFSSLDKKYYDNFCSKLSTLGYAVFNVNYRLIPQVKIDGCYEDCQKAVNFCLEKFAFIDKQNIYFCGDSAGATISAMLACWQNKNKIFGNLKIKALLLYYGVYDLYSVGGFTKPLLDNIFIYQYDEGDMKKLCKDASPFYLIEKDFPPCFIASGDVDNLNSQSLMLMEKLNKLGVKHTDKIFYARWDGFHGFLNASMLKSYKESFAALKKFLKEN